MSETSVGNTAYQRLRADLLAGRYQPEQRLIEADLVRSLQASRVEIREAFTWLERDRLIERRAHRGASVKVLTQDEVRDILRVRRHLEGLVARWAAESRSDTDVAELRTKLDQLVKCHTDTDLLGYAAAQASLHHELVRLCGSPALARLVESLSAQTAQTRLRSMMAPGRFNSSVREHAAIVDAVIRADADGAERAMHDHIDNILEAVVNEH